MMLERMMANFEHVFFAVVIEALSANPMRRYEVIEPFGANEMRQHDVADAQLV